MKMAMTRRGRSMKNSGMMAARMTQFLQHAPILMRTLAMEMKISAAGSSREGVHTSRARTARANLIQHGNISQPLATAVAPLPYAPPAGIAAVSSALLRKVKFMKDEHCVMEPKRKEFMIKWHEDYIE